MAYNTRSAPERRPWTRDECLLALDFYCRTPFGRLHAGNPDVTALAELLNRSSGAVAMKAVNFASLDPQQQQRGISGLKNISKLDRQVFEEFLGAGRWLEFLDEVETARHRVASQAGEQHAAYEPSILRLPEETEIWREAKVRRVQSFFRRTVLGSYDMCCAFCRLGDGRLLAASHIIPWADDETRRADPRNGLSLCALHDRAFDRGLMSVDEDLSILVSRQLLERPQEVEMHRVAFVTMRGERMTLPTRFTPDPAALAYHRKHRFEADRLRT
jgi:hypothetical protein